MYKMCNFDEKKGLMGLLYIIRPQYSIVSFLATEANKRKRLVNILRDVAQALI